MINFNLDNNKKISLINNRFSIVNHISLIIRLFFVNLIRTFILINNNKFIINMINNQILNINFISLNRHYRKHVNRFNLSPRQTRTISCFRILDFKMNRIFKKKNKKVKDFQIEAVFKDLNNNNV